MRTEYILKKRRRRRFQRHVVLKGALLSSFELFPGTIKYRPSKQTKR